MKTRYATYTGTSMNVFYRVPIVLLDSAAYPDLTIEGILVYGLLLDRMSLSVTHVDRFADDKGRIFIIYTIDDIAAALNLKRKKVMNLLRSLEDAGLIAREKSPGMNNTTRIYVKNFAAPFSQAAGEDAFPYFYTDQQADIHSFIQVPFSMLKDPVLSCLTLEEIFLYCLLHDRLRLSMSNQENFSDENGVYIYFGIESIMKKMRVGKRKAINMLSSLDEDKGIGLVKKERAGGWSNKNKLYIKKYVPSDELLAMLEKEKNDTNPSFDDKIVKKSQNVERKHCGTKPQKGLKVLKFKKVPIMHHRKSRLRTIESPIFAPSEVPITHHRKSDFRTIESSVCAPSKVPIMHPNHTNINQTNKNKLKEENLKEKSNQFKSGLQDYENDTDEDSSFTISFADLFAEVIELHNILPNPDLADSWKAKEKAKEQASFMRAIFSETVRAMELGQNYRVDGITYTVNQVKKELLSLDSLMFMEACDRIRHTKKEIRHWDKYIITVLMQVKRTFVLSQQNKISIFEGKLEKKD